ncbi:hypothetical protein AB0M25_17500 [Streptomyces griseomycini]|uniref:hypothetical protein n=1 Tax=Streptomyces griseomycini TaxID=66895 RepID=UPI00342A89E1
MAQWGAGRIADGTLGPATGVHPLRADVAHGIGRPEELHPLVSCAHDPDEREEGRGRPADMAREGLPTIAYLSEPTVSAKAR